MTSHDETEGMGKRIKELEERIKKIEFRKSQLVWLVGLILFCSVVFSNLRIWRLSTLVENLIDKALEERTVESDTKKQDLANIGVLTCEKLVLESDDGRKLGSFESVDGSTIFSMLNDSGEIPLVLSVDKHLSMISMKTNLIISSSNHAGVISLRNVHLSNIRDKGSIFLSVDGKNTIFMGINPDDRATVGFLNEDEETFEPQSIVGQRIFK